MLNNMTLEQIYLSWFNDFLTVESFANYYGIKYDAALSLLTAITLINKNAANLEEAKNNAK